MDDLTQGIKLDEEPLGRRPHKVILTVLKSMVKGGPEKLSFVRDADRQIDAAFEIAAGKGQFEMAASDALRFSRYLEKLGARTAAMTLADAVRRAAAQFRSAGADVFVSSPSQEEELALLDAFDLASSNVEGFSALPSFDGPPRRATGQPPPGALGDAATWGAPEVRTAPPPSRVGREDDRGAQASEDGQRSRPRRRDLGRS